MLRSFVLCCLPQWRQRLVAEHASAAQWRDQWGFLEHNKPGGLHVDQQIPNRHLTRTIAEQGPLYPYLLKTHREQRDHGDLATARFTVGGTARNQPSSGAQAALTYSNSNAFTHALQQQQLQQQQAAQQSRELEQLQLSHQQFFQSQQQHQPRAPPRRRQLGDPVPSAAQTARTHRSNGRRTQRGQQHSQQQQAYDQQQQYGGAPLFVPHPPVSHHHPTHGNGQVPPLHLEPLQNAPSVPSEPAKRPVTPVLYLELDHAKTLVAGLQQDIGGCVSTNGVDPHVKYRHPLTTSHRVGWNVANTTLEFFGVAQHATKPLTTRRLYGWD